MDAEFDGYDAAMVVRENEQGFDEAVLAAPEKKSEIEIAETPCLLYTSDAADVYSV